MKFVALLVIFISLFSLIQSRGPFTDQIERNYREALAQEQRRQQQARNKPTNTDRPVSSGSRNEGGRRIRIRPIGDPADELRDAQDRVRQIQENVRRHQEEVRRYQENFMRRTQ
eukprot:TRINITY_DN0_c1647_g1_i2.p1 TRINITY_DN0_c1647_g1~~TRINITY_DN0_c1647_g1_i2.p1  ORF type:complete len:114 (+),score=25.13 TRINITY_DN0_c1647_g1_i2:52-393(+)